ncbi:MAG TPA: hypothetical protein GYA07_04525 [Verrucomicrobia bacterium]|nr:hypothetical protein [Verrucomicrobiota bacterium]HOB31954.1 energy-coupling factor ABC transporter permease [Verrucomicrobiota bacterium]HOP97712.1 energy-coupling factor ABC transporter permease [Verrucomicrobiota bacterium]HPU57006.1 energy-coupling factor ABC transporter permease [Verrucomicrobiota bacterium]
MHIPDGFLDGKTAGVAAALSVCGVGMALRQVKRELPPRKTSLLGLSAAFLFAAQMVNFPILGGTSGHLIGSALITALLGLAPAIVVMTAVLIVQCFLFSDGGVVALGANVFNMAVLGCVTAHFSFHAARRAMPGTRGEVAAVAFAGWCAVVAGAITCAAQLAWSGRLPWTTAFPAMALLHMLIGIGEGLISALVYLAIVRARPDLANTSSPTHAPPWTSVTLGMAVALGIAIFLAPFASTLPDGLESVAQRFGFEHAAVAPPVSAPMPDYEVPGISWSVGATAVAGAAGTVIVFLLALALGRLLVPRKQSATPG